MGSEGLEAGRGQGREMKMVAAREDRHVVAGCGMEAWVIPKVTLQDRALPCQERMRSRQKGVVVL